MQGGNWHKENQNSNQTSEGVSIYFMDQNNLQIF